MRTLPIGDDRISASSTGDELVVRSPYDGHEIDRVPACGSVEVERAVALAVGVHRAGPLPAWQRAEILDRAAHLLSERTEEFARIIAEEAAKPIKTARVEAKRAVSTFTFAASRGAAAHRRDGAARRVRRRRGQARVHAAAPDRRGRRDQPVQLPAQPRRAQARPRDRGRVPGGAQARVADARCRPSRWPSCCSTSAACPPATSTSSPAAAARSATRSSTTPTSRSSRSPAPPRSGGASGPRAPRKKVGLELGNNAPVIIEPDGDVTTAATKISVAGFSHAGQSCISTQRIYLHDGDRRRVPRRARAAGRRARRGRSARRGDRRVGADLDGRARAGGGVDRRGRRRRRQGRDRRHRAQRGARADRAHRRAARHEGVQPGGVRPGRGGADLHRRRRRVPPRQRRRATGSRPRSSPATSTSRCVPHASSTSEACSSTRCRPGAPTRCPTAACATAATPGKARTTPCTR